MTTLIDPLPPGLAQHVGPRFTSVRLQGGTRQDRARACHIRFRLVRALKLSDRPGSSRLCDLVRSVQDPAWFLAQEGRDPHEITMPTLGQLGEVHRP